jgi:hypothetical protein
MKGPTLRLPSGRDWGASIKPQVLPEEMIAAFTGEILDAIPLAEIESHEDTCSWGEVKRCAEIVALYLARFHHFQSPWWADEAMRKVFSDRLPLTKAAEIAHTQAADLRLADKGQDKPTFLRQGWEDHTFFQVAAMRATGVSAKEASQHAARWRDEFSDGDASIKASSIEKGYSDWASDPLRGKVWCSQLLQEMAGLTPSQKLDLIQCNSLRADMLPPCSKWLIGVRR